MIVYESVQDIVLNSTITPEVACALCGITTRTWRRWRRGQIRPPAAALALLNVLAGAPPWPGWENFRVLDGRIYPPGSAQGFTPAELAGLPFALQELELRRRQQQKPAQYLLDY